MIKDFDLIIYKIEFLPFTANIKSFEISLIYDLLAAYYQYSYVMYSSSNIQFIMGIPNNCKENENIIYDPFDIIPIRYHKNFTNFSKMKINLKLNTINFLKYLFKNKPVILSYITSESSFKLFTFPLLNNYIRIVSSNLKTYDPPIVMLKAIFSRGVKLVMSSENFGSKFSIQLLLSNNSNLSMVREITKILKDAPQISGNYLVQSSIKRNFSINEIFFLSEYSVDKKNVFEMLRTIPEVLAFQLQKINLN